MTEQEKEIDRRVLANVQNGIELLKKKYGNDWVEKIDLDTLDLRSPHRCVLGQLFRGHGLSGYEYGVEHLDLIAKDGQYGFSFKGIEDRPDEWFHNSPWEELTRAWSREILYLRGQEVGL